MKMRLDDAYIFLFLFHHYGYPCGLLRATKLFIFVLAFLDCNARTFLFSFLMQIWESKYATGINYAMRKSKFAKEK